jgi:hypothetical protein
MGYDANDPKQIAKAKKQAEFNDALKLDVIRGIMASPAGRQWIYGILERCHIYGNPFTPGQSDSTAFNLGEANIGRIFLSDVQSAAPDLYLTMIQEAKNISA